MERTYDLIIKATGWSDHAVKQHIINKMTEETKLSKITFNPDTGEARVTITVPSYRLLHLYNWFGSDNTSKAPFPVGTLLFFKEQIEKST